MPGLLNTIRPILTKNKLSISQDLAGEYLITTLMHESGQFKGSAMIFNPMTDNRGTNNLQQIGGGITYVDDDAQSMAGKKIAPAKKVALPVGMYEHAGKAYERDGNFDSVEKVYILDAKTKKVILKNIKS